MKHLYYLTCLLIFTSCITEENDFIQPEEPFILTNQPILSMEAFSDEEFEVLSARLDISQEIGIPETRFPRHLEAMSGQSGISLDQKEQVQTLLGRMLFYDNRLSVTGETNCASCHKAELAFGDDVAFSKGINNQETERNSIALASVPTFTPTVSGYGSTQSRGAGFFWDGRASNISSQSVETISNPIEMGKDLGELVFEIRQSAVYQPLIRRLFPFNDQSRLRTHDLTEALEAFCNSITSVNTPMDRFQNIALESTDITELTQEFGEEAVLGSRLFKINCASCHGENFAKPTVLNANNGLAIEYTDKGIGLITSDLPDHGVFKVPFLRNVELTAPYMHDGSLLTLRDVIDHYSEGIQGHPNLSPQLKDEIGKPIKMNFTEAEKDALIAFLKLSTDLSLTTREHLQNPWRD